MNELLTAIPRFLEKASGVHLLVAGDCMLDAYVVGTALRISPEAPVPVVGVARRRYVAGGAANVAANARAMGAAVSLAGVTGVDHSAVRLREQLSDAGIGADAVVEDALRPTTTKTRVTAGGQQIVRFDDEDLSPLAESVFEDLRNRCLILFESCQVCVISDYAKGVISADFCQWFIGQARRRGMPIVADPKARSLDRYRGATLITPNLKETAAAAGELNSDLARTVEGLLRQIAPSSLLVTRGGDGMSLFESGSAERHLPAVVNEVADVTGAGDTVVAALAVGLGCGFDLATAVSVANLAAGIAVGHHGTWAVTKEELLAASRQFDYSKRVEAAPAC